MLPIEKKPVSNLDPKTTSLEFQQNGQNVFLHVCLHSFRFIRFYVWILLHVVAYLNTHIQSAMCKLSLFYTFDLAYAHCVIYAV